MKKFNFFHKNLMPVYCSGSDAPFLESAGFIIKSVKVVGSLGCHGAWRFAGGYWTGFGIMRTFHTSTQRLNLAQNKLLKTFLLLVLSHKFFVLSW